MSPSVLLLTILVPELQPDYKLDISPQKIAFSGQSKLHGDYDKTFAFDMDLFAEVEVEQGKKETVTGKGINLVLRKKGRLIYSDLNVICLDFQRFKLIFFFPPCYIELAEDYWPRLTKG